jgi:L-malate glycosyltransferase
MRGSFQGNGKTIQKNLPRRMKFQLYLLKRKLEDLLIWPFILLGRARADKYPLEESYEVFFFFPFFHTGGAEKVHAQIAQVFRQQKCLIIFTRKSHDQTFLPLFQASGHRILDISAYTDNKKTYWKNLIWRGVVSTHINRQKNPTIVFNGQCNFAYKCAPWIKAKTPQLELIHSFNSFSWIRIPFLPFIRQSIMISRKAIKDHEQQYAQLGIPGTYLSRIRLIMNGIPLPADAAPKEFAGNGLNVLYAGRATPEKRVHLVAEAALQAAGQELPLRFYFMGEVRDELPEKYHSVGHFYGNMGDPDQISAIYAQAHLLVITSSEEGFPMVVMEAMAMGCIILATPVGDLPHHIRDGVNGFIFSTSANEEVIIEEMLEMLQRLSNDSTTCRQISENNRTYAAEHFGWPNFAASYQQLFQTHTRA